MTFKWRFKQKHTNDSKEKMCADNNSFNFTKILFGLYSNMILHYIKLSTKNHMYETR